jgi:cysteine synthase B
MIINNVVELIGDTPLLEISPRVHGLKHIDLYAKCELFNPFGSVKDRTAWGMLAPYLDDIVGGGKTVIESSSGNTAKALQTIASMNGVPFKVVTNRIRVDETREILNVLGAQIEELPGASTCPDPSDENDPVAIVDREVERSGGTMHATQQYRNSINSETHYRTTGEEIVNDLGHVDYLIGGVGTAGSTGGVAKRLAEENPALITIGVIAPAADMLPGIRNADELWEVGLFSKDLYQQLIEVRSVEAIDAMMRLNREAGLLAGPTSGGCFAAALGALSEVDEPGPGGARKKAVFIACDRVEGYLSYLRRRRPDIFGAEMRDGSLSSFVLEEGDAVDTVSIDTAPKFIENDMPLIVDTRGNRAFRAGHIARSVNIDTEKLEEIIELGSPFDAGTKVLLVCPVGKRTRRLTAFLRRSGVEAYTLEDGIVGWRDAGLPLVRA